MSLDIFSVLGLCFGLFLSVIVVLYLKEFF